MYWGQIGVITRLIRVYWVSSPLFLNPGSSLITSIMTNEEFIKSISQEGEEWRTLQGYSKYRISNKGRVLTLKQGRNIQQLNILYRRVLIPTLSDTGYLRVSLYDDTGFRKVKLVHRLVAEAFIDNPHDYPCVDHINTVRTDNSVENLQWVTHTMNANNPRTKEHNRKSHNPIRWNSKRVVQLTKDREYIATYETISIAANATGCAVPSICRNCKYKTGIHHGFIWMYESDYNDLLEKDQSLN